MEVAPHSYLIGGEVGAEFYLLSSCEVGCAITMCNISSLRIAWRVFRRIILARPKVTLPETSNSLLYNYFIQL